MRANFSGVRYDEHLTRSNSRNPHLNYYGRTERARDRSPSIRHERYGDAKGFSHPFREERVGDAKGFSYPFREEEVGDARGLSHTIREERRYVDNSTPALAPRSSPHSFKPLEDILQNLSLDNKIGDARNRSKPQDHEPVVILKDHHQHDRFVEPRNRVPRENYREELDRHERRKRRAQLKQLHSDPRRFHGSKFTLPSRYDWVDDASHRSDPRREVLPVPPAPRPRTAEIPRYKGRDGRRGERVRDTPSAVVIERVPQYEKWKGAGDGLRERGASGGLRERGLAYLRDCRREGRG